MYHIPIDLLLVLIYRLAKLEQIKEKSNVYYNYKTSY
jgi:hypothetical protein